MNTKNRLLTKRSIRSGLAFILVALVAGISFLFKPFPTGPSLVVESNAIRSGAEKSASANTRNSVANQPEAEYSNNIKLPSSNSSSVQKLDIGAGYVLETNAQGGRIVAPERFVAPAKTQRLDIGAGYVLETDTQGGRIVAPKLP
jgi:hypothetical protein